MEEKIAVKNNIGRIRYVDIENEMRTAYLDYAMSVIVSRALPDVRDGLKPVHRRILYAMYDMGNKPGTPYRKSARIVGDVLGKYHPHSDAAVYDAMARMAQDFSMRYMLVDGQGNFGSVDGDNPAAMRYTEARMAHIAAEMVLDIEKDTVDWQDNFDASLQEPTVLTARIPNMLLNGSSGIAVGMATNIPPHNLTELCDASIYLIDNFDKIDEITVGDLMQFVKGPDFPTGGIALIGEGLIQAYATGKGVIAMRAVAEIEEMNNKRHRIVVTEIPYQLNKANLIVRIADLVKSGKLKDISGLRDESDRKGMAIIIELKRGAQPLSVLNQLYKYTPLQSNFNMNMLALLNGEPRKIPLRVALKTFIEHRQDVISRRSRFDLVKAKKRAHILEGLRLALSQTDVVIKTIRHSDSTSEARAALITDFDFSEEQANAILEMQLRRLAALERQKIDDEYQTITETIVYLEGLLVTPDKILALIRQDLQEIKEKYGDERRTQIEFDFTGEIKEKDLVKKEEILVSITRQGYIKRVPSQTYRQQGRGGKGVRGMTTRDEDDVVFLFSANTHDTILYFSDKGKVYSEMAWRIPDASRIAKGMALVNLIKIEPDEKITAVVAVSSFEHADYLTTVTHNGRIKRTNLKDFASVRSNGLIALSLGDDDKLGWVRLTTGYEDFILVTKLGQSIRFAETDVRVMGRQAAGVNAIKFIEGDSLAGVGVVKPEHDLLVVTERGLGKRTPLDQYTRQNRYGFGMRTLSKTYEKTGAIIDVHVVKGDEDISLMSSEGKLIRISVASVPQFGRSTRGARVMNLDEGDTVASVALLHGIETMEESDPNP
ncbi:MAG: DNA gyrase subunit A [Anaerolineaceae bacterium 4572_78]|nr:MAG: DNA gyrase subunit A [Anaerolineaceae bacterium 4572_78]